MPAVASSSSMLAASSSHHHHPSDVVTLSAAMLSHEDENHSKLCATTPAAAATPHVVAAYAPTPTQGGVALHSVGISTFPEDPTSLTAAEDSPAALNLGSTAQQDQTDVSNNGEGTAEDGEYDEDEEGLYEYEETEEDVTTAGREVDPDEEGLMSPGLGPQYAGVYFRPTLTPIAADLEKLNLVEGCNRVRYITQTSLRGTVVVEAHIYYWPSDAKIVVSDIDGTVTKSDVWGHLLPLIGRDWTHPGICGLYSKVERNGYKFLYLTARSIAQQEKTSQFLWGIEQDGDQLPRGPVLTAPDRFFTALTQEVSKKSHEFKIACLKSVLHAFPKTARPFYAGFGNRIGDVISYTATQIPKHKIFIIDPNSTLHVCKVKQTYKNLSHMVDVTFPPLKPSAVPMQPAGGASSNGQTNNGSLSSTSPLDRGSSPSPGGTLMAGGGAAYLAATSNISVDGSISSADGIRPSRSPQGTSYAPPGSPGHRTTVGSSAFLPPRKEEEEAVDPDFNSFNFWRMAPEDLVAPPPPRVVITGTSASPQGLSSTASSKERLSEPVLRELSLERVPGDVGGDKSAGNTPVSTPQDGGVKNASTSSGWSRWWGGKTKETPVSPKEDPPISSSTSDKQ